MNIQTLRLPISIISLNTAFFAVFFILLPVIFSNQVIETASLPRFSLTAIFACGLLLVFSLQIFTEKTTITITKLHITFFIFFCWALLSINWSVDVKNTTIELTQLFAYFTLAFFASQINKKQIRIIFVAIYTGASIAAVIGILQAFNFNPLGLNMTTALASTFNNKNHAAVFFDLVIPLALISMLTTKSYEKYIASIAYTLAVTFILLAKTKGSILGYIVFSLFFLVLIYKNKSLQKQLFHKKIFIHFIVLSFIVPLSIYTLTNNTPTNINNKTAPISWNADLSKSSVNIRLSWYKNAYTMFEESPLAGVGYGAFRKGFTPYAANPNIVKTLNEDVYVAHLHNDPYQNFLELGIPGGGLIVLIFSYIIFRATSILSNTDTKNKNSPDYILLGTFLALIASITHSFVDFPLHLPSSAALFWFVTGVIILQLNKASDSHVKKFQLSTLSGSIIFIICIFFSWHNFDLYQRFFTASNLTYKTTLSIVKEKNCTKAKKEIDQAIDIFFDYALTRQRYVQVYSYCDLSPEVKLAAMNRVLNYDLSNARARLTRANLMLENKEFKRARADFSYLTYVLPHRPAAYLGLGDIATLNKDYSTARKYYEKAKILQPTNEKANFMLKQLNDKGV